MRLRVLAAILAGDLTSWSTDSWLVIDDYQVLAGAGAAEGFVEALLLEAPLNVLILSRRRPSWTSSRRILYGEVFELDRSDLAMSDVEARQLLANQSANVSELIELATGLACSSRTGGRGILSASRTHRHSSSVPFLR